MINIDKLLGGESFCDDSQMNYAIKLIKSSCDFDKNIALMSAKFDMDKLTAMDIYNEAVGEYVDSEQRFWGIDLKNDNTLKGITMREPKYIEFLNIQFNIFRINEGGKKEYVQIKDSIVSIIKIEDIKFMIQNWVRNLPKTVGIVPKDMIETFIYRGAKKYFNDDLFDFLPYVTIGTKVEGKDFYWRKDTATHSFHFLMNTCLVIDQDSVKQFPYKELQGFIWNTQIKPITYVKTAACSDYRTFINMLCNGNDERFQDTMTCLGYMLHTFKFPDKTYAISFNDEFKCNDTVSIVDKAEGGTGKGLLLKALGKVRNLVTLDGKLFRFDKSFLFSRIELDTEIILLDDICKGFDFSKMFSVITEGITTEKKGKDEFYIPYEKMGKIALTTNYVIQGDGNSYSRRKIDVELANVFSDDFTPRDCFHKSFFDDWNSDEWSAFVNFMLECQMLYFKLGVRRPITETMDAKQISQALPRGLFDKFEYNGLLELNREYSNDDLKDLIDNNTYFKTPCKLAYAKDVIKKYTQYKGLEWIDKNKGDRRVVIITRDASSMAVQQTIGDGGLPF